MGKVISLDLNSYKGTEILGCPVKRSTGICPYIPRLAAFGLGKRFLFSTCARRVICNKSRVDTAKRSLRIISLVCLLVISVGIPHETRWPVYEVPAGTTGNPRGV